MPETQYFVRAGAHKIVDRSLRKLLGFTPRSAAVAFGRSVWLVVDSIAIFTRELFHQPGALAHPSFGRPTSKRSGPRRHVS
jgi:hypothetical protein